MSSRLMLTDTGSTLTYLRPAEFDQIVARICEDKQCSGFDEYDGERIRIADCEPDYFFSIWFKFDNHWYQYAPNAYLKFLYE